MSLENIHHCCNSRANTSQNWRTKHGLNCLDFDNENTVAVGTDRNRAFGKCLIY